MEQVRSRLSLSAALMSAARVYFSSEPLPTAAEHLPHSPRTGTPAAADPAASTQQRWGPEVGRKSTVPAPVASAAPSHAATMGEEHSIFLSRAATMALVELAQTLYKWPRLAH